MLGRPWRMTGYLPLDWCIFIEILKWTCTKQWRCPYLLRIEVQILDNFKKFLSIKVFKIVLISILYEALKWPQIAPFCQKNPTPLPPLKIYDVHKYGKSWVPVQVGSNQRLFGWESGYFVRVECQVYPRTVISMR